MNVHLSFCRILPGLAPFAASAAAGSEIRGGLRPRLRAWFRFPEGVLELKVVSAHLGCNS